MELNASDTRSKKMLGACLGDALNNLSLSKESKNRVLLMDEVDGMAGKKNLKIGIDILFPNKLYSFKEKN